MAVTNVTESYTGLSAEGQVDETRNTGTLKRFFDVEFNGAEAACLRPVLALSASYNSVSVPDWWDPLSESYPYWYVRKKHAVQHKGPMVWRVTVEYDYYENPLVVPPRISWKRSGSMEAIDRDKDGEPMLMSSGEPVDPPLTREFKDRILRVEWNMLGFSQDNWEQYTDAVNDGMWTPTCLVEGENLKLFMPYTVKCLGIDGEPERVGNIFFHRVAAEFTVRVHNLLVTDGLLTGPLGWRRRVLDQGFCELGVDGKQKVIVDDESKALTLPVKLDGSGKRLAEEAEPFWHIWADHDTMDFSGLPWPLAGVPGED